VELRDNVKGVHHLCIPVMDMKEALGWYQEKLGFQEIQRKLVLNPYKTEAAFLRLGDLWLELLQPSGRELVKLQNRGDGILDHFAINAPDLEKCVAEALKKNMAFHSSTPQGIVHYRTLGACGVEGVNFVGPNGEVVEFCRDNSADNGKCSGLQGWAHLALKVRSLSATKAFYGEMGFEEKGSGYLDTPDGRLYIAFLEKNGFVLEVIQMTGAGVKELESRGEGHLDHIALEVEDIEEAYYKVRKLGFRMKDYVIRELPLLQRGIKFFTVFGPDGEKVEFSKKSA
jgi:catechol 2,3-dioxygenase-like lactoylglutathione lyase family enzyme